MNVPLTPLRFKDRALGLYGRKIGVVCGDKRYTYGEFFERCDRLSHVLQTLGIGVGDRVAFLSHNCHRLLEAYYGVVQIGAVLLPINIRLSGREFSYILNDSEAKVLFFDGDASGAVAEIRPSIMSVRHLIPLEDSATGWLHTTPTYDQLLSEAEATRVEPVEPDENDPAELFYTSGTTANPKGVMLTHRNLYLHTLGLLIATKTSDADTQLHTIPLFHVNGWGTPQTLTCVGGTHVLLNRFDPSTVFRLIAEEKVTLMSLVPTMASALLRHPELGRWDCSSLRLVMLGGAAPSRSMVRDIEKSFGCLCYTGYGLTETSPVLTMANPKARFRDLPLEERQRRQSMTGMPLIGTAIRVVDENGTDVANDGKHVGEIIARGDSVMGGYWNQPEETDRAFRGGWFHTGDMATIDEEGYLSIVDRKKDVIISGGENIASVEIETCIASHPSVLECAVIAVPDPKWGEVPKALVVVLPGANLSATELLDHCRHHLAAFKCPQSVEFFDALPKGGTGKILKRLLRERYWSAQDRVIHG